MLKNKEILKDEGIRAKVESLEWAQQIWEIQFGLGAFGTWPGWMC